MTARAIAVLARIGGTSESQCRENFMRNARIMMVLLLLHADPEPLIVLYFLHVR